MRPRHVFALIVLAVILFFLVSRWRNAPVPSSVPPETSGTKVGPAWAYPDPARTPGFPNPEITRENIAETICNPEWSTRTIRPPENYTSRLKREQMRDLGLSGRSRDYEEDHFISLELGGNPTDPRNLWPEPYGPSAGAREKDVVENYLHKQVCSGSMTLQEAQNAIVTDWYAVYLQLNRSRP